MSSLASSYKGAAQATAFSRGMSPDRFAERSEAYASKEASDQKLELLQKTKPTDADYEKQSEINSQKLDLALGELSQAKRQQNLQSTYQAFQRYDADKFDIKHFNQLLTDFKARDAQLFSAINRVDKIIDSPEDRKVMDDWGISKTIQDSIISNPQHNASYVIITGADGTKSFGDMDALKQFAGGYNEYATGQEITRQTDIKTKEMLLSVGLPTDKMSVQAFNETKQKFPNVPADDPAFLEAYRTRYEELRTTGRSRYSSDSKTNERRYVEDGLAALDLEPDDEGYYEAKSRLTKEYKNLADPSKVKSHKAGQEAQKALQEMKFLDMDTTEIKPGSDQHYDIETKVQGVEKLLGYELDSKTKTELLRIQGLAHLGEQASNLTSEETGLLDNFMFGVKKYIFDEAPPNTDAAAAYALYRNVARHAQFGSVLPAGEIKSFAEAFGSMGMQIGPVLTMLRESLVQQMHQYKAVAQMENPYVMKWRTGMGAIELEDTINKLNERISMIDVIAKDEGIPPGTTPPTSVGATMTEERKAAGRRLIEQRKQPIGDGQ